MMQSTNRRIVIRIAVDAFIAVAVIQGWWYAALAVGLVAAWSYDFFPELIVAGIAYDSLFGLSEVLRLGSFLGTIVSVIALVLAGGIKKVVRRR
jgi:hypothetical protein